MSILGAALTGARVLDLYAGSGALGLEALGVADRVTVHRGDALRFAGHLEAGAFDLVLADPPYTADAAARLVALFRRVPFARILSVEHPAAQPVDGDETRRYGDTAITFCHSA